MTTVREGTKSAAAIEVMEDNVDKPMEKVIPLIEEAAGLDYDKAKHYYVLFVRKGLAPGFVPPRAKKAEAAPKAPKVAKAPKAVKAAAKAVKAVKPTAPTKSADEIEKIKAANMERMRSVLAKTKQTVRKEEETPAFTETDSFAAPAFLTKDELVNIL
jgi:hypothetical protein